MSLQWDDPRLSRLVQRLVDTRVAKLLAKQMPQPHYGEVVLVDEDTREVTVRQQMGAQTVDLPHVPMGDFLPSVGQRVLVMRWPASGDMYIERADGEDVLVRRLGELGIPDAPPIPGDPGDPDDPPPVPPPAVVPFPRMSMWKPYWDTADVSEVTALADDLVYMHQDAVILMGMEWGSEFALPADCSAKLDLFISRGIEPYLGLWVGHLDIEDQTVAQQAITAGAGKWAGIVLDAETGWVNHVKDVGEVQARTDFDAFMAIVRPATDVLVYACYASPPSFNNYKYSWWNEVCDFAMPMAYFNSDTDTADKILDSMYRKFAQAHNQQAWTEDVKPIVPLMNGYSTGLDAADVAERQAYIERSLGEAGAVSIWRWTSTYPSGMREMLHTI